MRVIRNLVFSALFLGFIFTTGSAFASPTLRKGSTTMLSLNQTTIEKLAEQIDKKKKTWKDIHPAVRRQVFDQTTTISDIFVTKNFIVSGDYLLHRSEVRDTKTIKGYMPARGRRLNAEHLALEKKINMKQKKKAERAAKIEARTAKLEANREYHRQIGLKAKAAIEKAREDANKYADIDTTIFAVAVLNNCGITVNEEVTSETTTTTTTEVSDLQKEEDDMGQTHVELKEEDVRYAECTFADRQKAVKRIRRMRKAVMTDLNRQPVSVFGHGLKGRIKKRIMCDNILAQILNVAMATGVNTTGQITFDAMCQALLNETTPHSNLGRVLKSVHRRMGHLPMSTLTMLPGGDGAPKLIIKTNGRDNIGLSPFAEAFGLGRLSDKDVLLVEANGVKQEKIEQVAMAYVKDGWRPLGARMLVRCFDEHGAETLGAEYVRAVDALLGALVDVRSYFSLGAAPALKAFSVGQAGFTTEREDGEDKPVLWFAGPAGDLHPSCNGTEGSLPISEKAMEVVYGDKKPGQPRFILRLGANKAVLFKGNHSPMAIRAFLQADGSYIFKVRGEFGEDEAGKTAWREGYDFVLLEEDTPKGRFKSEVKYSKITNLTDKVNGNMSGWLIAEASESNGSSLVSYQVLALLARCEGLNGIADDLESLIKASVKKSVRQVHNDLDRLHLEAGCTTDLDELKRYIASKAPNSSRQTRKNHLGFGAAMSTGYIFMNKLIAQGNIVVGNEFGLSKAQIKREGKNKSFNESACGGKNPILDANQTWVGKAWRLRNIERLRNAISRHLNPDLGSFVGQTESHTHLGAEVTTACQELLGNGTHEEWLSKLNWILAYAPSLTRGSILMNHVDVANLAGDDDGDCLWFSFRQEQTHRVFLEVKAQAQGNEVYSIETNKKAQLPSDIGSRAMADLLTAQGEDLEAMVKFIMAPNKGQGPVGYLANLCTILITLFKKVDNDHGGMKFENVWVERLQAVLNLMQQTAIDMQKRIFGAICLLHWTLADLRKSISGERGLVPGYDFPVLARTFDKAGFDPFNFSAEDYAKALSEEGAMPEIPHHWNGALMPACTEMDSQYAIGAIGSWLIWECVSLVVTGKPAAWTDDIHPDAKGGLNPYELSKKYCSDEGPAFEQMFEDLKIDEDARKLLAIAWQEKASTLYSWKSADKGDEYAVAAPPALELNHKIALDTKRELIPAGSPSIDFNAVNDLFWDCFRAKFTSVKDAKWFVDTVLANFYQEAAVKQNLKSQSEKFQSAHERSGVEALNLLLDALDLKLENARHRKIAEAMIDALNPRVRLSDKDECLGAITMLFAWHYLEYGDLWAFELMNAYVTKVSTDRNCSKKAIWLELGFEEDEARSLVHPKGKARYLLKSKLVKACYAELDASDNYILRCEARSTFFIDEGLPAIVKGAERVELISNKRDILKNLKSTCALWGEKRSTWSNDRAALEILVASFRDGDAAWFGEIRAKLEEMTTKALDRDAYKAAKKEKKKSELKAHKNAGKAKALIAMLDDRDSRAPRMIDALCDPAKNPLARLFVRCLTDNLGPVINVERAWQRSDDYSKEYIMLWTRELGDWVSYSKKDPETGIKGKATKLMANSRVEWSLADDVTAYFARTLLEGGVSFYKLTPIPTRNTQTWRYFDAFVYGAEPMSDWQLSHGLGHLLSMSVPLCRADQDKDRTLRMDYPKFIKEALEELSELDFDKLNSADAAYFEAMVEGCNDELARLNAIEANSMFMRWGHLYAPITWGFEVHAYAGQRTPQKLNGRAMNALATLGRENENWHEQPNVFETEGPNGMMIKSVEVGKKLEPNWPNIRKAVPFGAPPRKRNQSIRLQRALQAQAAADDGVDILGFDWSEECPDARLTYTEWLDFIKGVAMEGRGEVSGLIAAGLFFRAHIGKLKVMDPNNPIFDSEVAEKCGKTLASTPSFEAKLHIGDLLRGDYVAPKMPSLTVHNVEAFFRVLAKIVS